MSSNVDLDDFVVRPVDLRDGIKLVRVQQKEPLIVQSSATSAPLYTAPADTASLDAFSRARVSNPVTLFDSSMEVDAQPLLWVESVTGSGAFAYNANQSSVTLSTGAASSSIIRQSRQYVRYQPGKSLLILFTFVLGAQATGITRRVGYFDTENGIFLEQTATELAWVIRSNASGTPTDTRVLQTAWDTDKLNGTGASGLTFSHTNANIGIIDLEWLGVGRVRAGFVINGQIYYTHTFENIGVTQVYMERASLPVRYEIAASAGGSNQSLVQICSTVISEGGYIPRGMLRAGGSEVTAVNLNGTRLPVVAIRLKAAYARAHIQPVSVQIANTSGTMAHFDMRLRATVTGGAWSAVSEAAEINTTGTAVSGGYVVASAYADNQASVTGLDELDSTTLINGADFAGTPDVMVVTGLNVGGAVNVLVMLQWREIF